MKELDQTPDEARTLAILRALASSARFRLVRILSQQRGCMVSEMGDDLGLAESTVSEHLRVVKEAGVVRGSIDGPSRCYGLNPDALFLLSTAPRNRVTH